MTAIEKSILVVGDLILDQYLIGKVSRISPEAPVPVVNIQKTEYRIGGCGNVAHNLVRLGHEVGLLGVVGADFNGKLLKEQISQKAIQDLTFKGNVPTICKTRIVGNMQQIVRYDVEEVINHDTNSIPAIRAVFLQNAFKYAVISDYKKGLCSPAFCQTIIKATNQNNGKVIVDPKGKNWEKYSGAFIVTPNLKELCVVTGLSIPNEDEAVIYHGKIIRKQYNFPYLLITRSEKGMTLIAENSVQHFKTEAKDVYDVTGAGDTVVATLIGSLARGYDLENAIQRANIAAGYVISKFGTYAISKDKLDQLTITN